MDEIEKILSEQSLETLSEVCEHKMDKLFKDARVESILPTRQGWGLKQVAAACLVCTILGYAAVQLLGTQEHSATTIDISDAPSPPDNHYTTIYIFESPEPSEPKNSQPAFDEGFWDQPMETKVIIHKTPKSPTVLNETPENRGNVL